MWSLRGDPTQEEENGSTSMLGFCLSCCCRKPHLTSIWTSSSRPKYSLYCRSQFAGFPGISIPSWHNLILTETELYYLKCTRKAHRRGNNHLDLPCLKWSHLLFRFQIGKCFLLRHDGSDGFGSCFFDIKMFVAINSLPWAFAQIGRTKFSQ